MRFSIIRHAHLHRPKMQHAPGAVRTPLSQRFGPVLASLVLLTGLLVLSVWNLTRSDALAQATRAYARGELAFSLQRALDHLERRPWSRPASLLAAHCLSRLDHADAAETYYKRAGELDLNDLQTRAFGLVRGNHRQRAIEAYDQILARWGDNVTALRRLAAVQLSENNVPQLEGLAKRLIDSPNGAAIGYTLRGAVAHNDHNYEQAVEAFEHVLELDPDLRLMPLPHQAFWSYLAADLIKMGRDEDTCRYLTKALNDTPDAELMNTLGRAYSLQGLHDQAAQCYQQAAEWEPTNYLPHFNLGKLELQRHRLEAAREHLELAQELAPQQVDVLRSLVIAYQLLQQPADVARIQQRITHLGEHRRPAHNPKDPWPSYAL
jgi:tetratricopeptide (TPR) repeat protein